MHVLVVCTANIARSPLAEAMLAASLAPHGVDVSSAGTRASDGHPAASASQELARLRGLDLTGHRSRPVTERLVQAADLVLTMSERHRDACGPLVPGAGRRTFTVRELVRLLTAADVADGPDAVAERLPWLVEQAQLARPVAPPPRGKEDVHDPIRDPWPAWTVMGATLDDLLTTVVRAAGAEPAWQPQAAVRAEVGAEVSRDDSGTAARPATDPAPRTGWFRRRRASARKP
ncbi:low molecular weight phosphatase family protein [Egicoccus sp. AB-alg2]|uniref:arsenate reductase/protein-tyrosine-phosphatase family protein n=1 Tax=Egicoccus sp. AB-alg2 TaxID=3242693 RepID=UPI00359D285A